MQETVVLLVQPWIVSCIINLAIAFTQYLAKGFWSYHNFLKRIIAIWFLALDVSLSQVQNAKNRQVITPFPLWLFQLSPTNLYAVYVYCWCCSTIGQLRKQRGQCIADATMEDYLRIMNVTNFMQLLDQSHSQLWQNLSLTVNKRLKVSVCFASYIIIAGLFRKYCVLTTIPYANCVNDFSFFYSMTVFGYCFAVNDSQYWFRTASTLELYL